jgi:hypothetical protein
MFDYEANKLLEKSAVLLCESGNLHFNAKSQRKKAIFDLNLNALSSTQTRHLFREIQTARF